MSKGPIALNQWEEYIGDLYRWINDKYELLEKGIITAQEYNEHLTYYNNEKQRIEDILSSINIEGDDQGSKKSQLTQETFEAYFGVTIDGKSTKKEVPQKIPDQRTPLIADQKKFSSKTQQPPAKQDWEYISETEPATSFSSMKSDQAIVTGKVVPANILLIGDSAVGRTSLRRSWMGKHFIESHLTTIGASIEKKTVKIDDTQYNITLTDLGGQDFYSGLRKNFYRNIDGAIIVFDLTRRETFRRIDFWISEFYRESKKLVPFILVGNKADAKNRVITEKEALLIVEKYTKQTMPKFRVRYAETSAKAGKNVNEIFEIICREIKSFKVQNQKVQ
ncbi:MAG: Rab family GTPase [Candidatus Kariarchaeaceae archaeon]